MSESPIIDVPADIKPPSRVRSPSIRLCTATGKDGNPCRCAALRGSDRCRHHSEQEKRNHEATKADSIKVSPLSELVALDITDDAKLLQFRQGLLAHVGRRTLGVNEARAMHELAVAMHKDAHGNDQAQAFTSLASSIAAQLQPPGGGGISGISQ